MLFGKTTLYSVTHRGKERVTLAPSKRERRSAKSEVSRVLFPDIGKITDRFRTEDLVLISFI